MMQWQAIGSSQIGVGHLKVGTPCQDNFAHQIISDNQVIIGAVSDGMGSAAHSELGSKIAVNKAVSYLSQKDWLNYSWDNYDSRVFFNSLLEKVVTEIQTQAKNKGYSVRDLACTLLAFVATPNWLAAMQVGDGLIVIRPSNGTYQLLFKPEKGEFANETVPVTSSIASEEMQCQVVSETIEFICAATDGIEHISLIKSGKWKAYDKFFEPLERQIMRSNKTLPEKEKILSDWLNSEEVNQKTDDDKTVLLCIQNFLTESNQVKINSSSISQASPHSEPSKSLSTDNKVSDTVEDTTSNIKSEIEQLEEDIYQLTANEYPHLKNELQIRRKTLIIYCLSELPLNKKHFLSLLQKRDLFSLLESVNIENKKITIKKVKILNQKSVNSRKIYWKQEISRVLLPFWVKKILAIATAAITMTLICVLIKTFLNQNFAILAYFFYSLILIFIFDLFVKKNS